MTLPCWELRLIRSAWSEAELALMQAVSLPGATHQDWSNLTTALRAQGRPADAEMAARQALRIEPGKAMHWAALGNCLFDQGRWQELRLEVGANPQLILSLLIKRGVVRHFELTRPTLHDIFVRIAAPSPEDNGHA